MHTAGILQRDDDETQLWRLTWDRIDAFLPNLRDEVFKPHESGLYLSQSYNCHEQQFLKYLLTCDNPSNMRHNALAGQQGSKNEH